MSDINIPDGLFFTEEHEWVREEGGLAVVGLSAFAADQLGDVTFVELPETGDEVEQMGEMCVVESVKAAADVYAPLSGVIAEVNEALEDEPGLINSDCYSGGWLVKLKDYDKDGLAKLMGSAAYREFVANGE